MGNMESSFNRRYNIFQSDRSRGWLSCLSPTTWWLRSTSQSSAWIGEPHEWISSDASIVENLGKDNMDSPLECLRFAGSNCKRRCLGEGWRFCNPQLGQYNTFPPRNTVRATDKTIPGQVGNNVNKAAWRVWMASIHICINSCSRHLATTFTSFIVTLSSVLILYRWLSHLFVTKYRMAQDN